MDPFYRGLKGNPRFEALVAEGDLNQQELQLREEEQQQREEELRFIASS